MKNLDKIITNILILTWVGLSCSILKAEVVITEFFILQADNSHAPQYVELYNNSDAIISLENWSITTLRSNGDPLFKTFFNTNNFVDINNLEIDPFGYFLISSKWCVFSTTGCYFYNGYLSDIIAEWLILPFDDTAEAWEFIDKGSIILTDNNNVVVDRIDYDINAGWPVGGNSRGHSLRLHSPELDNSLPENWSLSPDTENSLWLYEENTEIKNFGSPREENSFRLLDIQYSDSFFTDISYANGGTHTIYGDVNNYYNAEPFVDDNGDGEWDEGEEFDDRNNSNSWDHQINNFGDSLTFSWIGTFIETPDIQYKIIIEKKLIEKNGEAVNDPIWENILDPSWLNIADTSISILPIDLLIDELGSNREIAEYTWTIELIKTYSDYVDTIYSDIDTLIIDASDYGRYGCVDNGSCTDDGNCPTNAYYEIPYKSNHPLGCIPGENCFSALNYYEDANINSNTCHYVSLSIPAFVTGDANTIAKVPVYLYNDSLANIDSIAYTLSFDNSLGIISYENGTFSGTVISELGDENINYDGTDNISVNGALSEEEITFQRAGIITYLNFNLTGSQGELISLSFSEVLVKGGIPENDISVPVSGGEVVILQTDYEIWGNVLYYDFHIHPITNIQHNFEVPNVILKLEKNYDGLSPPTSYFDTTYNYGYYKFDLLMEGNYNLSFSKDSTNDCNGNYISGTDISRIARHVTGSEPFNADQFIAADVSLDGTVSGQDASLVAQYSVDLIDNFNDIKTHWIFQPFDLQTLPDVHAELVNENGQYSIEYKPLVLDDKSRNIFAYRLGDVNGNYCYDHDQLPRYNNSPAQFTNIAINYKPVVTLPIIISEAIFLEGMDIEIGFDENVFSPHSITFNTLNKKTDKFNSFSNLLSNEGTIKTITWATNEPQMVEGIIGEVSFNWNNKNKTGKIWLKDFQVNDEPAVGGISIIGLSDNDVVEGVNIINSLIPVELSLHQNYPNPFNPQTTIYWSLPNSGNASIDVYNIQGQLISHLFDGYIEPGTHEQLWNASSYPSGIYFYRLTIGENVLQKKMILLQ